MVQAGLKNNDRAEDDPGTSDVSVSVFQMVKSQVCTTTPSVDIARDWTQNFVHTWQAPYQQS